MNLLKAVGAAAVQRLAYIGGLTVQFWSGVGALPRVLPILGRRARWLRGSARTSPGSPRPCSKWPVGPSQPIRSPLSTLPPRAMMSLVLASYGA